MPARKGRDSSGHVDPFYQRRRRFEPFLRALNLYEVFNELPRNAREGFWLTKCPDPILEFEPSFLDMPDSQAIRTQIEQAFREASLPVRGLRVRVREFLGVLA